MLLAEAVSLLSFVVSGLSLPLLIVTGAVVFAISLKRLAWGIYILFGELFVGSRGHLLEYGVVSLRLVIFTAVFAAWFIHEMQNVKIKVQNDNSKFKIPKSYWLLLIVIVFGIMNGYFRGNALTDIFYDANGYLYLLILSAVLAGVRSWELGVSRLFDILGAAIVVIAAKTLLLFIWFGYDLPGVATAYHWIINLDFGEITGVVGSASRIFMASQFWALMGVFVFGMRRVGRESWGSRDRLVLSAAILAVMMSLSRSFWLGGIAGAVFAAIVLLFYLRAGMIKVIRVSGVIGVIIAIEIGGLYALSRLGGGVSQSVTSRAVNPAQEAAGSARLLLLPELVEGIKEAPIFGKGFGQEVSYDSFLPDRITADNPTGRITSYAFEWGYFDMLLKVGAVGVLLYLLFIARIFKVGFANFQFSRPTSHGRSPGGRAISNFQILGLLSGLVALLVLNITTPYLNHPLGIGYLIFLYSIFQILNSKHEAVS